VTDIVERLRDLETRHRGFFLGEAADEIERLRAALKRLVMSGKVAHHIGTRKTDIWEAFGRDLEEAHALAEVER
jgi:hypothetical protein